MGKKESKFFSEFTVLGIFTGVVFVGIIFGVVSVLLPPSPLPIPFNKEVVIAPTVEEYQSEVRGIMTPVIAQIESLDPTRLDDAGQEFVILIKKTQGRMLDVIVPSSMREAHFSFVLLLQQWGRAADGSYGDRKVVQARTADVLEAHAWIGNYGNDL